MNIAGTKAKPNEIRIARIYDAPVKAVWDAWTDTKQVEKWWGPRGFTTTTHSKDLRVGGHWHYTMHGPDGTDYENTTKYLEVVPMQRLVYDHGGHDERKPLFRVTAIFSEVAGKTVLEMTMALKTAEEAAETRKFIKKAGGNSTWDRLAEYLEEGKGKETFFIARTFAVGVEKMFEMWTRPEHMAKWLPPAGFEMGVVSGEIREGGGMFYWMGNSAMKMYGKTEYLKIQPPGKDGVGRVVYRQMFCDEKGNAGRHPGAPGFPSALLADVEMVEEEPGLTRVRVRWEPAGEVTASEIAEFAKMRGSMTGGWTGSFDKLEELVAGQ